MPSAADAAVLDIRLELEPAFAGAAGLGPLPVAGLPCIVDLDVLRDGALASSWAPVHANLSAQMCPRPGV